MFYMNSFSRSTSYQDIDTLVIDEAHGFEDVIQRVFSSDLPISVLKEIYDIDVYKLVNTSNLTHSK